MVQSPSLSILPDERRAQPATGLRVGGIVAGTRLLAANGYRAVETLRVGDNVATLIGRGSLFVPIGWIGRRIALRAAAAPVRIKRNAIATSMPSRDIVVAPDHAVYLAGAPYRAVDLVNGLTIRHEEASHDVEYWGVRLHRHDILVAESLAIESTLNKAAFDEVTEPYQPMRGATRFSPWHERPDPIDFTSHIALSIGWFRRRLRKRGVRLPDETTVAPRQAGRMLPTVPDWLNFETEARAALAGLAELAANWHVQLEIALQPDLSVFVAPRTLHELLDIVVVHAMEAAQGGKVVLGAMRLHERLHIAVIDDGAGRDAAVQRADLRRVEEIAALLGGKLEIENWPGEGSVVSIRLPCSHQPLTRDRD